MRQRSRTKPHQRGEVLEAPEFEQAARAYRKAISEADRVRSGRMIALRRCYDAGISPESAVPTEAELQEAEKKLSDAFWVLSGVVSGRLNQD